MAVIDEYMDNNCYCGDVDEHFTELGDLLNTPVKKVSVGSEGTEPVLCDSGHCTDMNDNDVHFAANNKLTLNDVTTDLFPSDLLFGEGSGVSDIADKTQTRSSTPPNGSVCIYRKQEVSLDIFIDELSMLVEKILFKSDALMMVAILTCGLMKRTI